MSEELDLVLAEQYQAAKRRLKTVKRLRKIMRYEKDLDLVEYQVHNNMKFFETMVHDKRLLKKKRKTKKSTDDILAKRGLRNFMKTVIAYSTLSYKMCSSYWESYMSFWNLK